MEKKGKEHFNMKNHAKMFYSCNQLPEINDDTDAAFRRFIITEWNQQFLGNKANKNLFNELTTEDELSGILNLLIHKARQVSVQQKLSYEQSTEELRMGWKEHANPIQRVAVSPVRRLRADGSSSLLNHCPLGTGEYAPALPLAHVPSVVWPLPCSCASAGG